MGDDRRRQQTDDTQSADDDRRQSTHDNKLQRNSSGNLSDHWGRVVDVLPAYVLVCSARRSHNALHTLHPRTVRTVANAAAAATVHAPALV